MEIYEAIDKRRTVRDFADTDVPEEKINRILKAGLQAPSYNHLREWDFILVRDAAIRLNLVLADKVREDYSAEELETAFKDHDPGARNMYLSALPKQRRMILSAPELLVVVYKPKVAIPDSRSLYDLNALASVWCCIENILLAMAAENLFGVPFVPQHPEKIGGILGIPPGREPAVLIPFGFRDEAVDLPPRNDFDPTERLHIDTW